MSDRAHLQLISRKIRDRSIVLLILGTVLLMPPVAGLALTDGSIAGIPVPLLYVFAVWMLLITGAAGLSRSLRDSDPQTQAADKTTQDN